MKNFKSSQPCLICGECRDGYVTYHHIYSRKSHPEHTYDSWNIMPLCQKHHNEAHNTSDRKFASKYVSVQRWFDNNGWEVKLSGQYYHPIETDE